MPKGETVDGGASERRRPPMDPRRLKESLASAAEFILLLERTKRGNPRKLTDGDTTSALKLLRRLPHEDPGAANG